MQELPARVPDTPSAFGQSLTGRQREVCALLAQGRSNKAICRQLDLAESTIKNHVSAVLKALGVTSRTEAAIRIRALGLDALESARIPMPAGDHPHRFPPGLPDKPSIVVLPFTNLSGDAAQNYFADGMVEELTMALGRLPWLFVIASTSAFSYRNLDVDVRQVGAALGVRYVLRGSIRKDGVRIRIAVQLADASHGRQIWMERFDGEIGDIFSVQDRLATQISAMIAPTLRSQEVERSRRKPTTNLSAYDLFLQALPPHRDSLAQNRLSLSLLYQAIALDPTFASAYGLAAWCHQVQTVFWVPLSRPLVDEALRLAWTAAETGERDPEALWMAGRTITALSDRKDEGLMFIARSISLNPSGARAWWASGIARAYLGQREVAIEHLERSQRLNPLDISGHAHWTAMAVAHFFSGAPDQALSAAGQALRLWPHSTQALRLHAAASALSGRLDEARECAGRLLDILPEATVSSLGAQFALQTRDSPYLPDYVRGLKEAGLPDDAAIGAG